MTDATPVLQTFEKDQTKVNFTINQLGRRFALFAKLDSPVFTGDPQAPTPPITDSDTSIATTAYVHAYAAPFDALAYNGMQINGSVEVSQERGTTATSVSGASVCDGWMFFYAGTMTISSATAVTPAFVPGFTNVLFMSVPVAQASIGAADLAVLLQRIEGYRISRLAWGTASAQPITLAFWSAHNRTGVYSATIRNATSNRSYAFTYAHAVTNVAQYNIVTIPGDTTGTWTADNSVGMIITFAMACGTTSTAPSANAWLAGGYFAAPGQINGVAAVTDVFRITGVVVLPGIEAPSATRSPLIMRPYDQELAICKRYFQINFPSARFPAAAGSQFSENSFLFPLEMRTAPTLTVGAAAAGAANQLATYPQAITPITNAARFVIASNAAGDCYSLLTKVTCDARL